MIRRLTQGIAVAIPLAVATFSAGALDTDLPGTDAKSAERRIKSVQKEQRKQLEALKKLYRELSVPPDPAEDEPAHVTEQRTRYRKIEWKIVEVERLIQFDERTGVAWPESSDPLLRFYYGKVRKRIEAVDNENVPSEDGKSIQGRVWISFTVLPQGGIEGVKVSETTSETLSAHALKTLEAAAPFDAFPSALMKKFDRIEISAPFTYKRIDSRKRPSLEPIAPP